jgi:hypothetical protein
MPNTYTELLRTTVGTATTSVTLSSIPSGYTDLVLIVNASSTSTNNHHIRVGNGSIDTGSNYSTTILYGDGSSAGSARFSSAGYIYAGQGSTSQFTDVFNFQNYSNTTTNKTVINRTSVVTAGGWVGANVGLWRSTSAINTIEYYTAAGNINVGATFSLYGIANANQGAAKATGGIITEDSQYWYHTFGASGAFVPKQSLSCDVLVVAGGGSGGGQYAGGGGAGGVAYDGARSLSATSYNVTIGGGGTAISSSAANGNTGTNTSFDTLVANGGGGGGSWNGTGANGLTGGSGGGGSMGTSSGNTTSGGVATQGASTGDIGYGSNGGGGLRTSVFLGGGGGGAGAVGVAATGSVAGNGGAGINTYSSWLTVTGIGVSGFIAGGGGGGAEGSGTTNGTGGSGGGGAGGLASVSSVGIAGTVNTGSGGGGYAANALGLSGAGGSGVVIVRYAK